MKRLTAFLYLFITLAVSGASAQIDKTIAKQRTVAIEEMFKNISPAGTRTGTVVASPGRVEPFYYFHWVRDASLVMQTVMDLYESSKNPAYLETVKNFVAITRFHQSTPALSGLGEPKYHVDGTAFSGPWGRPQDDGPALRALVLLRALPYLNQPETAPVIQADLDYVAKNWRQTCFDLWEEIRGHHFYTRMVQYAALIEGAKWFSNPEYFAQAEEIRKQLRRHYDSSRGVILQTLDRDEGISYKSSNLDIAAVLALLHSANSRPVFFADNGYLLKTIMELRKSFGQIYPVNRKYPDLETAYGRYPEDRYKNGNPWFLTTFAVAEHHYRLAVLLKRRGRVVIDSQNQSFYTYILGHDVRARQLHAGQELFDRIIHGLIAKGDQLLARGHFHMDQSTGRMDEQIDRDSGYMRSAEDLTWSYASYLTATRARARAEQF